MAAHPGHVTCSYDSRRGSISDGWEPVAAISVAPWRRIHNESGVRRGSSTLGAQSHPGVRPIIQIQPMANMNQDYIHRESSYASLM